MMFFWQLLLPNCAATFSTSNIIFIVSPKKGTKCFGGIICRLLTGDLASWILSIHLEFITNSNLPEKQLGVFD